MANYVWAFIIVLVFVALLFILPTPNVHTNNNATANGPDTNTINQTTNPPVINQTINPPVINQNTSQIHNLTDLLTNQTCSKGEKLTCVTTDGKNGVRPCVLGRFASQCFFQG